MSPTSPFLMGGGQSNWQILDHNEKCPICRSTLENVWGAIGGFPGHEHVHPSSVVGYQCHTCNRYFSLGDFLLLKEERARKEARVRNYWKNVLVAFQDPCLYVVIIGFGLLYGLLVGIVAGVAIAFLIPLLARSFKMFFSLMDKIGGSIWKKLCSLSSSKPPKGSVTP